MKELTTYNRAAGYLRKVYRLMNEELFDNELPDVTITIQSTPKAYGHYSVAKVWNANGEAQHEINIGAGTLARPVEETLATLCHECCHALAAVRGIKDTSNQGVYHNTRFRDLALEHGLECQRHSTYGWTITSAGEGLIDFILSHDLTDIKLQRMEPYGIRPAGGHAGEGGVTVPPAKRGGYRRYVCPKCGTIARTTKDAKLICGDCLLVMVGG